MGQKLRHQITIWIGMNEKRNMRIMIMSYVKNVIKKFISGIIIIAQVVMIRKLIVVNKIVWIMENVNHVLCEKCNQEINKWHFYCTDCYDKEADRNERNHMKYGYGKSMVGIFIMQDYDLNLEERKQKYKDYEHILCEQCNLEIYKWHYY